MSGRCIIGTRGSKLALWQANAVADALRKAWPQLRVELEVIKTTGDVTLDVPLHEVGDKALFTKELEGALLAGDVDLCVHSMKDVPTELPHGCRIAAMLARADARDVLVCGPRIAQCRTLAELPHGARIGTGSLRRAAQLKANYPQVEPVGIRGNVDTRLRKACGPDYDGCILAAAGVERMGEQERIAAYLDVSDIVPAAGQGAIGIEVRSGDARIAELVAALDDARTSACVRAERQVLAQLGGSCKVPVGVYARVEGGQAVMDAVVLSLDGGKQARAKCAAAVADGCFEKLARDVLAELEARGARELLDEVLGAGGVR